MDTIKNDTMKQFLQKQPHRVTMARHNLGIHQIRIMSYIVYNLQHLMSLKINHAEKQNDIWTKVRISDLVIGSNVTPLRNALEGLIKKTVRIKHYIEEESTFLEIGVPLIKEYNYKHGSSFVELQISGHLLPQLIDLARGYTKYRLEVAFKTSSPNVYKLYQYVAHFRDIPQINCNVSLLRKWLQLEDKYKKPADIKRRVLEPAIKELKQIADVWFDIAERVTDGRKMVGWKFNIYTKKEGKKTPSESNTKQQASNQNPVKERLLKRLIEQYSLSKKQALNAIEKIDTKKLQKALYDINLYKDTISNIGGYTVAFLSKQFDVKL